MEIYSKETVLLLVYVITGLIHPLLLFSLTNAGATNSAALLFILPSYIGMSLCSLHLWYMKLSDGIPPSIMNIRESSHSLVNADAITELTLVHINEDESEVELKPVFNIWKVSPKILVLIICDVLSSVLHMIGLNLAGPTQLVFVYSSITISTAVTSRVILKRHLSSSQWISLILIAVGMNLSGAMKSLPGTFAGPGVVSTAPIGRSDIDTWNGTTTQASTLIVSDAPGISEYFGLSTESVGVVMIACAALVHPFCLVLTEMLLTDPENSIAEEVLCATVGIAGLCVFGIYELLFTIPRWQTLVTQDILAHHGSVPLICCAYALLVLNSLAHTLCFFHFIRLLGSVSITVVKGLQGVLLFACSHVLYCGATHPSQCWSRLKAASMLVILSGVILYANTGEEHVSSASETPGNFENAPRSPPPGPGICLRQRLDKVFASFGARTRGDGELLQLLPDSRGDDFSYTVENLQYSSDSTWRQQSRVSSPQGSWLELVPLSAGRSSTAYASSGEASQPPFQHLQQDAPELEGPVSVLRQDEAVAAVKRRGRRCALS